MSTQPSAENPGSAPEPQVPAVVESKQFHEFTAEERNSYLKTLKPPKQEPPKPEGSAPPETAATTEGETPAEESKTASESASEPPQEKGKGKAKGTGTPEEKRIPQLLSERNALERRVAELEKQLKEGAAPTKAEPAPQPKPAALEAPKEPKWEEFQAQGKTYEEYDAATKKYYQDLVKYEVKAAVEEDRKARYQAEVDRTVAEKIQEAKGRYEDYDTTAVPFVQELTKAVQEQRIHPLVTEAIGRQPHMADIMYVIGKDTKEVNEFLELAKRDPLGAAMRIAIYEQLVQQELASTKANATPAASTPEKPEPSKPAKQVTSAPPPPTEIGGKAQKAPDPLEEALKNGDVGAYRRELNRQLRAGGRG